MGFVQVVLPVRTGRYLIGHVLSSRLAAIALLVLENEEDAFWCLVAIVEAIMPQDYYSKTLIASQVHGPRAVRVSLERQTERNSPVSYHQSFPP